MLYGIVDIGSNTIRLKIYEYKNNKIKSVFSKKKTAGLIAYRDDGKLNDEGINILSDILNKFNKIMDLLNVSKRYFFATASLRNISNTYEIIGFIKEKLGIKIHILDDETEAQLSFNSVKDIGLRSDEGILTDVGGGSCEIIIFENKTPIDKGSLPIGSLSCYEDYVGVMFPNKKESENIEKRVIKEIEDLDFVKTHKKYLFGVGGTVRNLKKLLVHLNFINEKEDTIPVYLLDDVLDELKYNNKENFNKILKVKAERIHTLVPGIIIIKTIAKYFHIEKICVCKNSIREGVLYSLLDAEGL